MSRKFIAAWLRGVLVVGAMARLSALPPSPPLISTQPESQLVPTGQTVILRVAVSGTNIYRYQWKKDGTDLRPGGRISGPTNAALFISNVMTNDAGLYTVNVSNDAGSITSTGAVLSVFVPRFNGDVRAILPLPGGKVLLGGAFTSVDGVARNRIARLNPDDSLDLSFDPGSGADGIVSALAWQPDGKILVGGSFRNVSGVFRAGFARMSGDGSLDHEFQVSDAASSSITSIGILAGGRFVLGGGFSCHSSGQGWVNTSVTMAGPDSSPVTPVLFSPLEMRRFVASTIAVDYDGKILLGGRTGLARFRPDGSLDRAFLDAAAIGSQAITSFSVQPDGKIVLGGTFLNMLGTPRNRLARLLADGTLDSSFNPGSGPNDGNSLVISYQLDGRIFIGGVFTNVAGIERNRIARLNADGTLDPSFHPGSGANGRVFAIVPLPNDELLVAGSFTTFDGKPADRFVRMKISTDPVGERVTFSSGLYAAAESATNAVIVIQRVGRGHGAISVDYAASAGTAIAGRDLPPQSGTVRFSDGDLSDKIVSVALTAENSTPMDGRTIHLALSNPIGAELIANRSTATLQLLDNDTGLAAGYFTARLGTSPPTDFFSPFLTRRDAQVAFEWYASGIRPSELAVIWKGWIVPEFSEDYTFHTLSDDSDRLWVDGKPIINDWAQGYTIQESTGSIFLEAGRAYEIEAHFVNSGAGPAACYLAWSSASQPKQIIPQNRLLPAASIFVGNSNLPPALASTPKDLTARAVRGSFSSQILSVWNEGGQPFKYTVSTNVPWLSTQPRTGTILPLGEHAGTPIRVTYRANSLPAGIHEGEITFEDNSVPAAKSVVPATFEVLERGSLDSWTRISPQLGDFQSSESFTDMTYGKNGFVAVSSLGKIVTSTNGNTWQSKTWGTAVTLNGVAYGDGRYVAVGFGGVILTSTDGMDWKQQSLGNSVFLYGVTYGGGLFVAVGNGTIFTSPDGTVWTPQVISGTQNYQWLSVTYGDQRFVAVSGLGAICVSTDGITWQASAMDSMSKVEFGNGQFVGLQSGGNAITFAFGRPTLKSAIGDTGISDVAFGNGTFVAVGRSGLVFTSVDGVTWKKQASVTRADLSAVTYSSQGFVGLGAHGIVIRSTDGTNWVRQTPLPYEALRGVAQHEGLFVAVGGLGTAVTSRDGLRWSEYSSRTTNQLNAVIYGAGQFLAVGATGTIVSSLDGSVWSSRSSGSTRSLWAVAYTNAAFTAVGDAGTILASTDGLVWQTQSSGVTSNLFGIGQGNGKLAAVGSGGVILTSPDGTTWTKQRSGTTQNLRDVTYGKGNFVAVGQAGTVITSVDGVDWKAQSSAVSSEIRKVIFVNDMFLAVAGTSLISSPDGSRWTVRDMISAANSLALNGIVFANNTYLAVGDSGAVLVAGGGLPRSATITLQPQGMTAPTGQNAVFAISVEGTDPISYQWRLNGRPLPSETNSLLRLTNVQPASAGSYSVVVSNPFDVVASHDAELKVQSTQAPRLASPMIQPGGLFRLQLTNALLGNYVIQVSTDLIQWQPVATNQVIGGEWGWDDSETGRFPQRFYRIVSP